jgi:glutathione synthase/RimK-type ligase-like ATP-grasp enzyme
LRELVTTSRADTVINWGDSQCPYRALNDHEAVRLASNKLLTFDALKAAGVPIPEYARTTDSVSWHGASDTVVRHLLQGHSGAGIEIVKAGEELPDAKLYVRYIKKQEEYRVHIIGKEIILTQRKARRLDHPDSGVNWQIRNHSHGFIFQRNDVLLPEGVSAAAKATIEALGLDFGAVDIIWNEKSNKAYVLEVNTAPGLEGTTVSDYANGFRSFLSL